LLGFYVFDNVKVQSVQDLLCLSSYLKGGNCFRKTYFDSTRYSPDIDFACTQELSPDFIASELINICQFISNRTGVHFETERTRVEQKKRIDPSKQGLEARIYFKDFFGETSEIIISIKLDISQFEKIFLPIQNRQLIHPYSDHAECSAIVHCLKLEEMLASKLKCLLQRKHSADLYDFVHATFLSSVVQINPREIVDTFLKMTIFSSGPGIVKDLFFNFPFQSFHELWDKYLICPKKSEINFDDAVEKLRNDIVAMFGGLPILRGKIAFFPPEFRNPIMEAGHTMTTLRVVYDGIEREVEPYSLKFKIPKDGNAREYFYVYDLTGGRTSGPGIKSLVHTNIQKITNTDNKFEPRFEVEISRAGQFGKDKYFHSHPRYSLMPSRTNYNYTIQCPICGKKFPRKVYDTHLNPHKDYYGNPCIGKTGYII
jgi:predicted nucleotidyltransferase component of viral defense system